MKHAPAFLALVQETMPRITEISAEALLSQQEQPGSSPASHELRSMRGAAAPQREHYIVIDVREDHEWHKGHIAGATHMGRGIIERDIEARIPDKSTPLALYCGGGFRSALSADSLQKMGYTHVRSLAGGWREWTEKNYPTE